ncbi:MAG: MerR family transcriptional regulator [Fibrobacteres bacterium]|nr:MerR family transcriptional regulator [Fibrobacterota bacterium]
MDSSETLLSIGDVSRFLGVPTHTIRYWEKEFSAYLNPGRTIGHQRRYTDDHVLKIRDIMRLLKNEGYSIAGAKKILELKSKTAASASPALRETPVSATEDVAQRIMELIRTQLQGSSLAQSAA